MLLPSVNLLPVHVAVLFCISYSVAIDEFDLIIIGGGTAGLTVANRLSEIPSITVAVIETGDKAFNNPNVTDPEEFTVALGTAVDWQYQSTNQSFARGKNVACSAGKALGGTSTINGMTWVRSEKAQIDSWGAIGNPGWSWDELFPYYQKSEVFVGPTAAQVSAGASYDPADHGESGPLKTGFPFDLQNGSLYDSAEAAWKSLGIPHNVDANGGDVRGFTLQQQTLDRDANVREDAARAFYYPIQNRTNLHVFLNTTATKVVWKSGGGPAEADGVEIVSSAGTVSTLKVRHEVVISAGSYRSPTILELSGIGNPSTLEKYGIATKVTLLGVGENLMDQPNTALIHESNETFNGLAGYLTFGTANDFHMELPGDDELPIWAEAVAAANNYAMNASSLQYLFKIQADLLKSVTNAEVFFSTTKGFGLPPNGLLASAFWLLMPFSRGSVHISSADPLEYPTINPNYFVVDYDLKTQAAITKWVRRFWLTEPMRNIASEISPGFDVLPANATDMEYAEWVKTAFASNSHPIGTAAMMPKVLGGVLDSNLKVYGTTNLRVVDASVIPFQISGHLTATIYAIAEKASDLIKADMK